MTTNLSKDNSARAIRHFLARNGLVVNGVVGRDDVSPLALKPDPAIVVHALELGGRPAEQAFLFGDSVSDVHAAHAAGVVTIGFGKTPKRSAELRNARADVVVHRIEELARSLRVSQR